MGTWFFACSVMALDGHNGINFTFTQKDVESLGFVCKPPKKESDNFSAKCLHMNMRGEVFGYSANNYEVTIGKNKKVDSIKTELIGRFDHAEYLRVNEKAEYFFPIKNEAGSVRSAGNILRDQWFSPDKSSVILMLFYGVPGVMKTTMSVSFWSPRNSPSEVKK